MRRIRIGAYLASAGSALCLLRLALGTALRPIFGAPGAPRKIGPVKTAIPLVIVLAVGGFVLYLMFSGPHMRVEPKLLPYQALFPAQPEGITPVAWAQTPNLASLRNPVADTEQTRRIGQAYYRDYCAFCHGHAGHGNGPVGRSYVPAPTDLTSPAVQGLADGALYRGMLTGVGHSPVLNYVVDPNAPWYIIHYVRSLRGGES
jgi:mono/diheme cytochrome c family protein